MGFTLDDFFDRVGRLFALLKELGLDENTLVMAAGDNGSSFSPDSEVGKLFDQASNGMRGFKRGLYEGALRQAALARWPDKVPAGRVSDEPWAFWDFLPTAAELAKQNALKAIDAHTRAEARLRLHAEVQDKLEAEIAENEARLAAAGRSCLADQSDVDWLLH